MKGVKLVQGRCVRSPEVLLYKGKKRYFSPLFVVLLLAFFANISHAAPPVGTNIPNQAYAAFTVGAGSGSVSSNTAVTVVTGGPTIGYYVNNTYGTATTSAYIGTPLFVQASAGACNLNPAAADTLPITVTSSLTGDTEVLTAIESAVNSGVFRILPNVPTRSGPTTPGNKIL